MENSYELGINLLKEGNVELSKEKFIKAYENGNKRALYYLRKIKNIQNTYENNLDEIKYTTEKSKLGYEVEIPSNWRKTESIDDKYFDTITIQSSDKYVYDIKTQGFLIEIPNGCIELISIDEVISNIGNIECVEEYSSEFCDGKLIKSEGIDGTINYTLMTTGKRGIYEFKVIIDQFLDEKYNDVKKHIFNSFRVKE